MKNDLLYSMYRDFVNNFSFFKSRLGENKSFKNKVILIMRPLTAYKEEYIQRRRSNWRDIFVKSGVLSDEIDSNFNHLQLFVFRKNDYFGIIDVLNNDRSDFNIKVKSKSSELFIIYLNYLLNSLMFLKNYLKFHTIKLKNW